MTGFPQGGCVAVPRRILIAASTNATLARSGPTALQGLVAVNTGPVAALARLKEGLDAEWSHPTDVPSGNLSKRELADGSEENY